MLKLYGETLLSQTSRAKRLAVKVITGSKAALRRADQLELIPRLFGDLFPQIREMAQAYAHHNAAPYSTEQQIVLDASVAAAWNRYIEKNYPTETVRMDIGGPCSGARFVERGTEIASVPLDGARHRFPEELHFAVPHEAARKRAPGRDMPELTRAQFFEIAAIVYQASVSPVDAAAFRAEASVAWDSLRHRKAGTKVKGDLIERDRLDDLTVNQAAEFARGMRRIRSVIEGQVRANPNSKGGPVVLPAPFRSDPASD